MKADNSEVVWSPLPEHARRTAIADFGQWVRRTRDVEVDPLDYGPCMRGLHETRTRR